MNTYYTRYYLNQSGGNLSDIGELYRSPLIYQRGRGIGSFFSGLLRYLQPLVASGAKAIKQQSVKAGKALLQEVGTKPIKDILKEQGKAAAQELAQKGINKLFDSMAGAGAHNRTLIKMRNPFTALRIALTSKRRTRSKSKKRADKRKLPVKNIKRKRKLRKCVLDIFDQ